MYTPCSVAGRVSATGPQLHVLLAVECVGLLEVMYMKSLMLVVVITYFILLTEVVYVQLLVFIGVILEEETSITLVVLLLQLIVFATCTCGQLKLLMLVVAV